MYLGLPLSLIYCFLSIKVNTQVLDQTCVEQTFNFDTQLNEGYKIDYNAANVIQESGLLKLRLTKETGGTRISLNNKLRYGSVSAKMKVSPGSNIVTSFILMADNGDEIDFEFVGKDDNVVQTNFFYKGVPIYDKNAKFYKVNMKLSNVFNTFTINWTPEYYEWKFNDNSLRKLFKNSTVNYPDSLSHVQFGIWKANPSNWAGWGVKWSDAPFEYIIDFIKVNCNKVNSITTSSSVSTTSSTRSSLTISIPSSTSSISTVTSTGTLTISTPSTTSAITSTGTLTRSITLETNSLKHKFNRTKIQDNDIIKTNKTIDDNLFRNITINNSTNNSSEPNNWSTENNSESNKQINKYNILFLILVSFIYN